MREASGFNGYEQGSVQTYTPVAFGQREDLQPIQVDFSVPTQAGMQRIALLAFKSFQCTRCRAIHIEKKPTTCPGPQTADEIFEHRSAQFELYRSIARTFVVGIRGRYNLRGKAIATGADLAEYGDEALLAEVAEFIHASGTITEEQKKSSAAPQSSSTAATAVSDGAAVPAASTTAPPASSPRTEASISTSSSG